MRIGHGYDIHRLESGRKLFLCGIEVEHDKGLFGHSDADAAIHALCDALLGAAALGDIGRHFPDNDRQYKDISSCILLENVIKKLEKKGYLLVNADITIIAQKPKLSPYIEQMRRRLGEIMNTDIENINIKATTEEGLGYIGNGEAIAVHSIVLIEKI